MGNAFEFAFGGREVFKGIRVIHAAAFGQIDEVGDRLERIIDFVSDCCSHTTHSRNFLCLN